ncbi:hypothetical protein NET02_08935 [Thermomicrobiaceae bacterium CFH 74404]|uniref:Molybdenum hydroxylase n=1 Tax=Thermalbibacter longus TaxID=2951981 RepID=A0AA41WAK9_9BACT|nr:hypothetical protein [Thermalbibacter longus]MCM8749269.1 hypothetical protein [Thermalbibacter longus]
MLVVVLGTNDVASAVAHRLVAAGYSVVLAEGPAPAVTRRGMAFADAVFDGEAELAGLRARRVESIPEVEALLASRVAIPLLVGWSLRDLAGSLRPNVLVDARMRKRAQPETLRGLAPLTVGLGPGFVAGEQADLAVETAWGEDLGRVIARGPTRPLEGEPREIAGHARDRYVYAPLAGVFETTRQIGELVEAGEPLARIGEAMLRAPLGGAIRGLTRSGVPVSVGTKVIEIDPRGAAGQVFGIGERPARIAAGVLNAIRAWQAEGRGA